MTATGETCAVAGDVDMNCTATLGRRPDSSLSVVVAAAVDAGILASKGWATEAAAVATKFARIEEAAGSCHGMTREFRY
jgi:hypothetical protein